MKKQNIYLTLLIASLILFACQKVIEFDKELVQPKLVINGFVKADSTIDVKVAASKSVPGVEKPFTWLSDAVVKLYVDGVVTETLIAYPIEYSETDQADYSYYNSNYSRPTVGYRTLNTKAEAGKTYRIEVSHPDYETAIAETQIPEKVEILSYSSEVITENTNGYTQSYQSFKLKFKDTESEKNYYRLAIHVITGTWSSSDNDTTGTVFVYDQDISYINSADRLLNPDQEDANDFLFGSPSNSYNLFTDEFIDGKEHELEFSIGNQYYYGGTLEEKTSHKGEFSFYTISLQSITKDAYLYMRSSYAQHWYGDDFFSEPVQAYSNVENGIGIFAGYDSSGFQVKNGEYPVDGVKYEFYDSNTLYF